MSDAERATRRVETLRESAPDGVTVERTTATRFADALETVVEQPAVGTPLPFDGVSLPDPVTRLSTGGDAARERAELLREIRTGVTPAGLGIAQRGTVTVRSRAAGDELVSLYPERHVAVLRASDLVADVRTAMSRLGDQIAAGRAEGAGGRTATSEVLTTGPSATGDMGGLVRGVHGPQEVRVLVLEDR